MMINHCYHSLIIITPQHSSSSSSILQLPSFIIVIFHSILVLHLSVLSIQLLFPHSSFSIIIIIVVIVIVIVHHHHPSSSIVHHHRPSSSIIIIIVHHHHHHRPSSIILVNCSMIIISRNALSVSGSQVFVLTFCL